MEFKGVYGMREAVISLMATALMLGSLSACAKDEPTAVSDKVAAETVIKGLYSQKISDYEFPRGKLAASKACSYMKSIFDSSLFEPDPTNQKCSHFGRFPNLYEEDLGLLRDANKLPKTQIVESRINGGEAVIKVKTTILADSSPSPPTRVVYFMRKTDNSWKIFNILYYENEWPLSMKVEHPEIYGCQAVGSRYSFLTDPRGPADLEDLPKPCQAYEIKERNRTKEWGK